MPTEKGSEEESKQVLLEQASSLRRSILALEPENSKKAFAYPGEFVATLGYPQNELENCQLYHRLMGGGSVKAQNFDLPKGELTKFITEIFPAYIEALKNLK